MKDKSSLHKNTTEKQKDSSSDKKLDNFRKISDTEIDKALDLQGSQKVKYNDVNDLSKKINKNERKNITWLAKFFCRFLFKKNKAGVVLQNQDTNNCDQNIEIKNIGNYKSTIYSSKTVDNTTDISCSDNCDESKDSIPAKNLNFLEKLNLLEKSKLLEKSNSLEKLRLLKLSTSEIKEDALWKNIDNFYSKCAQKQQEYEKIYEDFKNFKIMIFSSKKSTINKDKFFKKHQNLFKKLIYSKSNFTYIRIESKIRRFDKKNYQKIFQFTYEFLHEELNYSDEIKFDSNSDNYKIYIKRKQLGNMLTNEYFNFSNDKFNSVFLFENSIKNRMQFKILIDILHNFTIKKPPHRNLIFFVDYLNSFDKIIKNDPKKMIYLKNINIHFDSIFIFHSYTDKKFIVFESPNFDFNCFAMPKILVNKNYELKNHFDKITIIVRNIPLLF
ncbi:hypothetical protein GVAV_001014 [Gurleya vavrai]